MVQNPLKSVEKRISLTLTGLRSVLSSRMEKKPNPNRKAETRQTVPLCRSGGPGRPLPGTRRPHRHRPGRAGLSGSPPRGGTPATAPTTPARQHPSFPVSPAGHSLQRVPEDPPVQPGHVPLRRLLPKRWLGRRGPLAAAQRRDGDQAPQQYVHVSGQPRHEAHILRFQVEPGLFPNLFPQPIPSSPQASSPVLSPTDICCLCLLQGS